MVKFATTLSITSKRCLKKLIQFKTMETALMRPYLKLGDTGSREVKRKWVPLMP